MVDESDSYHRDPSSLDRAGTSRARIARHRRMRCTLSMADPLKPELSQRTSSKHTFVMATQKGGSGKSTLSIGLAVAAKQAGHIVRLIETDKQGTLSNWQYRRGLVEPIVEAVYEAR